MQSHFLIFFLPSSGPYEVKAPLMRIKCRRRRIEGVASGFMPATRLELEWSVGPTSIGAEVARYAAPPRSPAFLRSFSSNIQCYLFLLLSYPLVQTCPARPCWCRLERTGERSCLPSDWFVDTSTAGRISGSYRHRIFTSKRRRFSVTSSLLPLPLG